MFRISLKIILKNNFFIKNYITHINQNISLMNENLTSENIKKEEININYEECEYKNLMTRLSEISSTIALLKKKYINKL